VTHERIILSVKKKKNVVRRHHGHLSQISSKGGSLMQFVKPSITLSIPDPWSTILIFISIFGLKYTVKLRLGICLFPPTLHPPPDSSGILGYRWEDMQHLFTSWRLLADVCKGEDWKQGNVRIGKDVKASTPSIISLLALGMSHRAITQGWSGTNPAYFTPVTVMWCF